MPITPVTAEITCSNCLLHVIFDDKEHVLDRAAPEDTVDIYQKNETPTGIINTDGSYNKTMTVSFSLSELDKNKDSENKNERRRTDSSSILKPVIAKAKKLGSLKLPTAPAKPESALGANSSILKKQIAQALPGAAATAKKIIDPNVKTKFVLPKNNLNNNPSQQQSSERTTSREAGNNDTESKMAQHDNPAPAEARTSETAPSKKSAPKTKIKLGAKTSGSKSKKSATPKTQRRLTKEQRQALDEQINQESNALKTKILLVNIVLIGGLLAYIFTR